MVLKMSEGTNISLRNLLRKPLLRLSAQPTVLSALLQAVNTAHLYSHMIFLAAFPISRASHCHLHSILYPEPSCQSGSELYVPSVAPCQLRIKSKVFVEVSQTGSDWKTEHLSIPYRGSSVRGTGCRDVCIAEQADKGQKQPRG